MKQKKLKLTPEEEDLILEKRKQKELEEDCNKSKKMGFFKEDKYLYYSRIESENGCYSELITKSEKDSLVKKFLNNFVLIKAGTKFVCFLDKEGTELWYDDVGIGIEEEDADWAKENLINTQDIK